MSRYFQLHDNSENFLINASQTVTFLLYEILTQLKQHF